MPLVLFLLCIATALPHRLFLGRMRGKWMSLVTRPQVEIYTTL